MWRKHSETAREPTIVRVSPERPPHNFKQTRVASIGKTVHIKGQLSGSEDLTIDGVLEGRIEVPDYALTIGPNADIKADIVARVVTIFGSVVGNVIGRDKVEIRRPGSLRGNLKGAHVAIQEGAHFCGKVEMKRRQ